MAKIKIKIKNETYEVEQGITPESIVEKLNIKVKDPVAAVINGYFTRLNQKVKVDSTIEFIELSSSQGKRVYESSVLFLFTVVFNKKFPNAKMFIQHSIHKGIYVEIDGKEIDEKELACINSEMLNYVSQNAPINRLTQDWDVSMEELQSQDRQDIVNLYRYHRPSTFKFFELDGHKESLHLPLVPHCGYLKYFGLKKYRDGLVVLFPEFNDGYAIPEFVDRAKIFKSFQEYNEWSRILKVRTVGQLNRYIVNNNIGDLIRVAEALHEKRVAYIADQITKRDHPARLVLIAGPSSSGKTTFSKRLGVQLLVNGFKPITISMDDYFLDRELTPRDKDGNYDFERVEALNINLFLQQIGDLLNGKEIELPHFDFHSGKSKPSGKVLKLESDNVIIIEGIHGLNPKLTATIDPKDKFKIYISALTQLNLHRYDRIPASDTRLIRRIVRDSYFRGYSASDTLSRWRSVRTGEKLNIFPLQEEADAIFNSALFYELSVLKTHAERELLRVEKTDQMYPEAQRLLRFLAFFLPLDSEEVPNTSLLKEFIGGSAFDY